MLKTREYHDDYFFTMSGILEITFQIPPDSDQKNLFRTWKSQRKKLVRELGHRLLMLNEQELTQCYEKWEQTSKELEKSDKVINLAKALLIISVLHYFNRSSDQIKTHIPFMRKLLESKNRALVMCVAKTFSWQAYESQECIDFLRESISLASSFIQNPNTVFAALCILRQSGKFILPNVFEETSHNFKLIWNYVVCDDIDLQMTAAKVVKYHMYGLKPQSTAPENIFNDCISQIKSGSLNSYGVTLVISYILQLYQNPSQAMKIIDLTDNFPYMKQEPLSFLWFTMLLQIAANSHLAYVITPDTAPKILNALFIASRKFSSIRLYNLSKEFFKVLNPKTAKDFVPTAIEYLSESVQEKRNPQISGISFDILIEILKQFDNLRIQSSFFLNAEPSMQYMEALKRTMRVFADVRPTLMQKLTEGFSAKANTQQQLLALTIFSKFSKHLYENIEVVFDTIQGFVRSPSEDVRLLVVSILPFFNNRKSSDNLLFLALFDSSKIVRAAAVEQLTHIKHLDQAKMLPQILTDPSYTVRRNAVALIAKVAPFNPMLFYVPITSFVQQTIISMLTTSNPSSCQKISTLLPLIAKHLVTFCPVYIPQIVKVCYTFLNSKIKESDEKNKILKVIQRDMCHDNNALITNSRPFDPSCTNLNQLFNIENKIVIDKRDANLFETLKCLSEHLDPYLDELLPVYISVLNEQRSETVYISALSSLIELTNKLPNASQIPSKHSALPRVLIMLLRRKPSETVAILILKLMATFGITSYPRSFCQNVDGINDDEFDFKSPSYYTDSVLSALVKLLSQNHSCVFESITSIFVKESNDAVKFLSPIIKAYSEAIRTLKPVFKSALFNQLEVISYYCGIRIEPYSSILAGLILQSINLQSALKLACVLSYHLKTEFIPASPPLYMACIRNIGIKKTGITQELVDFLTYSIIYQNQPFDVFISAIEERLSMNPALEEINKLLHAMITIVQLSDVSFESSRIARICIPLLKTQARSNVMQLLYSLVVYCQLSFEFIELLVPDEDIGFPALKDYLAGNTNTTDGFLTHVSINLNVQIPSYVPLGHKPIMNVFDSFQAPPSNTEKWLEDLCTEVIQSSPQLSVRACHQTALTSPEFRIAIFPVAFLSCWRHTTESHRNKFSNTMNEIFSDETQKPDQVFLTLAELLYRAGYPFNISGYVLARACTSPMQGLRFLVRYFQENPHDPKALEMLLEVNTQLGRFPTAKGLLKEEDLPSIGKWSETLGEWDKALDIYERDMETNLPAILRCYAKLERWEDIRKLSDRFQTLSTEQKQKTALWYSWASLKNNDFNNISSFMVHLPETNDYDILLFRLLYYIQSGQYDKARQEITTYMKYLVSDCSIYTSLNASQADKNLVYAHHFTELEEVLNVKASHSNEIPAIWNRRLNYITGDGYSWMRLCEIRSLVVTPTANKKTYLKLLSVLVKERKWVLVDRFQPIVLDSIDDPEVQITYVKILWARGRSAEAIESTKLLNIIHNSKDFKEFKDHVSVISPDVTKKVAQLISSHDKSYEPTPESLFNYACNIRATNQLTDKQRARMLRLEASWRSDIHADNVDVAIKLFEKSSKIDPNEYRTWANWAYASTKAIDTNNANHNTYVQMAIDGFLKASILRKSNTLEYLCQLFSLFFRYASTSSIPQDLFTKISKLDPQIIERILPQVVCQIAHSDEKVKDVVHALIVKFAVKYFQAIVFPLQLIADGGEGEKSTIASDLLAKISLPHKELAKEANIFADGLIRSAVTYFDTWYTKIDEAYHFELLGDHEKSMEKLRSLTKMKKTVSCKLDSAQLKSVDSNYNSFVTAVNKNPRSENEINNMWSTVRIFFQAVRDRLRKLDVIQLETVSEELAKKRNFMLSVPGTYNTNSEGARIVNIDPALPVLGTQQHPRILFMHGSDGQNWKFLLKGNEDLRLDQRIMQFFDLINSLLKSTKINAKNITIINYPITPLSPIAGLISWVTGADTLHQLVTENRKSNNIQPAVENEMLNMYVGQCAGSLLGVQRLEMWSKVAPECPATDLRDLFWMKCQNPVQWLQCVDTFCISTALMSMSGYVIGLGDRHPSNIMIQRKQGHVVHIDFGDSFEVTMNRIKMPEKVPFRLTRMITNALGVAGTEGMFKTTCENILYILRKNKSSIFAQLEIFVHEPIFASRGEQGNGASIMQRVSMKLNGLDPTLDEGTEVTEELTVEEQVKRLISIASDYRRYITHYDGWCPYW